jgi:methylisocitrate lyase
MSAGKRFREQVEQNNPLQIVGAVNAYSAIMAERIGHKALYLSGGGVAACSMGIPDLGITTMQDVLTDAMGGNFNIARCVREMTRAGVAAVHIEDQVMQKRCGHRPNKAIVSQDEMVDRIKAAVDAKTDENFVIMARTDAMAVEGMDSAVARAVACAEAGADMIFPEAINTLDQYRTFADAVGVPCLANITEFGSTPLFTAGELASAGIKMQLFPLSAFRAMSKAAINVYERVLADGTQQNAVDTMQTRMELYDFLGYHEYEQKLDELFAQEQE